MWHDDIVSWGLGAGVVAAIVIAVAVRPPVHAGPPMSPGAARSMRSVRRAFLALGLLLVGVTAVVVAASLDGTVHLPRSRADSLRYLGALVDTVVQRGRRDSVIAGRRQRSSDLALAGSLRSDARARLATFDSALAVDSANGYAWQFRADELARAGRCTEARAAVRRAAMFDSATAGRARQGLARGGCPEP